MWEKIEDWYYTLVPYEFRPKNLFYNFKCWAWYRYRTIKPRTLPGQGWVDRDHLLYHSMFEILSQFIEKELKGYREEDWDYYYIEQEDRLIQFGPTLKDPYYIMDYLNRWFKFYLEKEEKLGDAWHNFCMEHQSHENTPIEGSDFLNFNFVWDSPENEAIGKTLFKRYCKKSEVLHKELEENLILLVRIKDFMWT